MFNLGIALGIWGAIIVTVAIIGKLLKRPLVDSVAIGIFIAMFALAIFLHPFTIIDGVYQSQYGDSIVAIIILVSLILVGCAFVYFFIRIGRCECCCKGKEQYDKMVYYEDLYSDSVISPV